MATSQLAIDIGESAVKAVLMRKNGSSYELAGVAHEDLTDLGNISSVDEKGTEISSRIERLLLQNSFTDYNMVLPISGRQSIVRYLHFPPTPPWRLEALVAFEAEQGRGIHGQSTGVNCWDYRKMDMTSHDGQLTVALALATNDVISERIGLLGKDAGFDPDIDMPAIGLYNAYVIGHGVDIEDDHTVALVDIGATEINICITRGDSLYFIRHQPGGGAQITDAIRTAKECSWTHAEEIKRTRAEIGESVEGLGDEDEELSNALRSASSALIRSIDSTMLYARTQTKIKELKIDSILLSGGGANLEGLDKLLAERLRVDVAPLEPLRNISFGKLSAEEMDVFSPTYNPYAVSIGLALSRLNPAGYKLDLRTSDAKKMREYQNRGLFLHASIVVFLLAIIFWVASSVKTNLKHAASLKSATELLAQDDRQLDNLTRLQDEHTRLLAEQDTLGERISSGEDLLRLLSQLKKRTPAWIILTSISTEPPDELAKSSEASRGGFATDRVVYLSGRSRSSVSYLDALARIEKFSDELKSVTTLITGVQHAYTVRAEAEETDVIIAEFVLKVGIAKPVKNKTGGQDAK